MNLFKNKTFQKAVFLSIAILAAVSLVDILSMNSGIFGTPENYIKGSYIIGWFSLYMALNTILISILPITYFYLVRRDYSETLSLFINSFILFWAGLADALFFFIQGKMPPQDMFWLMNSPMIGRVATTLGYNTVTPYTLLVSVAIGLILVVIISKLMEKI